MIDVIQANWLAFALALLIGLLVAYWLFGRASTPAKRHHTPDVLDEGAAPAQRNQSLIDAPTVAVTPPPMAGTMAGLGEAVAIGAQDVVEEAEAAAETPTSTGGADDLLLIKGVGPKLVALLASLGVTRFAQIAEWSADDIARIDGQLGTFAGRIERDSWVEQCRYLSSGDTAGFEGKFGKL